MIQRKQSIYLLITAILMLAMVFLPVMEFSREDQVRTLSLLSLGSHSVLPGFVLPAMALLISLLTFVVLFLYKNRKVQMQISCWILVLLMLFYSFIFYSYNEFSNIVESGTFFFPELSISFPLISLLLVCMAISAIKKDDRLVSSLGRLR